MIDGDDCKETSKTSKTSKTAASGLIGVGSMSILIRSELEAIWLQVRLDDVGTNDLCHWAKIKKALSRS